MQHVNCVNGHWFWFWPFGVLIGLSLIIAFSRFWWWGRGGNWRYWQSRNRHYDALVALDLRYAKGDISKEEYHSIRKALRHIDYEE